MAQINDKNSLTLKLNAIEKGLGRESLLVEVQNIRRVNIHISYNFGSCLWYVSYFPFLDNPYSNAVSA